MGDSFHRELNKRLMSLKSRQAELHQTLEDANTELIDLNRACDGIETLLRIEGATVGVMEVSITNGAGPPLYDTLIDLLSDGRTHPVEDLIRQSQGRGVDFGDKDPYKTTSMTLLGIARGNTIKRIGKGLWRQARQ